MIKTRLVKLLSSSKKYIVYNILWQWVALISQIIIVFVIAWTLGSAIDGDKVVNLMTLNLLPSIIILVAMIILRFVSDRMASKASYSASVDVKRTLREQIHEKLLRLGTSYQEKVATSEVVQLSTEGVEQLETYFGRYLPQFFYSLLAPITLFGILSFISLKASVILLICVPLIPLSIVAVQKIAKKLLSKYWKIYAGLGDSFLENLQGLTTLKIYQADETRAKEMDEESDHFRKITMKVLTMQLNSTSVMDIVAYGGAAVGMIVACSEYLSGNIGFSGTIAIILLAAEFFLPLRLLGSYFHIAMNGMAASDKIFKLLDMEEPTKGTEKFPDNKMDIKLENVHFSYDEKYSRHEKLSKDKKLSNHEKLSLHEKPLQNKSREILKGIDLVIPTHSFVSFVGASGCGKSTIISLLTGKNKNYSGNITIGDKKLSDISESELMKNITLVKHNSYLFGGTVRDNLMMAKPFATDEEMIQTLQKVNLWEFLASQNGLDTVLGEKAGNLSGGQCQRLAIARALLHDTPIYLFDEATSNIDTESEEMIMNVIKDLTKTKTVLLISHRLANVIHSDKIFFLQDGKIKESGTHDELLSKAGEYSNMYLSQKALEMYSEKEIS